VRGGVRFLGMGRVGGGVGVDECSVFENSFPLGLECKV
jgi:hypothetical protein